MANADWLGTAAKTRQVTTITVTGPVLVAEVWTVQVGNKSVTTTGHVTTTAVGTALLAALTASPQSTEFAEMSWVFSNPTITGTATSALAGVPITIASSTDSAGGSLVTSTTTTATGPWHLDNVLNWSGGALPASGDSIYFGAAENGPKYALTALSAVTPALVSVRENCNYQIGLPSINASGYAEYRARYLVLDGATKFLCLSSNSTLMRFNFGSTAFIGQVDATGSSAESEAPCLNILGSGATNALEVNDGDVGVAWFNGETATVKTILQTGGTLTFGAGCTLSGSGATAIVRSGSMYANSSLLTVDIQGGTGYLDGTGTITTLSVQKTAKWVARSSGTITTLNLYGTLDPSLDSSAKIITTLNFYPGGNITDRRTLTITTPTFSSDTKTITCA